MLRARVNRTCAPAARQVVPVPVHRSANPRDLRAHRAVRRYPPPHVLVDDNDIARAIEWNGRRYTMATALPVVKTPAAAIGHITAIDLRDTTLPRAGAGTPRDCATACGRGPRNRGSINQWLGCVRASYGRMRARALVR